MNHMNNCPDINYQVAFEKIDHLDKEEVYCSTTMRECEIYSSSKEALAYIDGKKNADIKTAVHQCLIQLENVDSKYKKIIDTIKTLINR